MPPSPPNSTLECCPSRMAIIQNTRRTDLKPSPTAHLNSSPNDSKLACHASTHTKHQKLFPITIFSLKILTVLLPRVLKSHQTIFPGPFLHKTKRFSKGQETKLHFSCHLASPLPIVTPSGFPANEVPPNDRGLPASLASYFANDFFLFFSFCDFCVVCFVLVVLEGRSRIC